MLEKKEGGKTRMEDSETRVYIRQTNKQNPQKPTQHNTKN